MPLYMVEFNLILKAAQKPTSSKSFWRLFPGTVVMLAFEDAGEASPRGMDQFLLRVYGEGYILFEIFKVGPMVFPESAQRQERMPSIICE